MHTMVAWTCMRTMGAMHMYVRNVCMNGASRCQHVCMHPMDAWACMCATSCVHMSVGNVCMRDAACLHVYDGCMDMYAYEGWHAHVCK
jgi:hypothetical protein